MPFLSEHQNFGELNDRIRDAHAVTAELIAEIISETCRRFPSVGQAAKTERIEQLIQSSAWTDAALALLIWKCRNGKFVESAMTRASGIARCRASVSFPIGSTDRLKPVTRIYRWRL
jgi:hypothetical protein